MRRVTVFNQVSVDGYFASAGGGIEWAHQGEEDEEFRKFVENNASGEGVLLFGRKTYQMMIAFWPTPMAAEQMPVVARNMNSRPKLVFSRTLESASWNNTNLRKGDLVDEVRRMKSEPGESIAILGSGTVVSQLTSARLIDEYQLLVIPVILGEGRTMFQGVEKPPALRLLSTRTFRGGKVLLTYQSVA